MDEFKIKIKTIAIMFFCCYALASCFSNTVKAEDITTGNLLPNGTGAASNLQSVDNTIPMFNPAVLRLLQLIQHALIQIGTIRK